MIKIFSLSFLALLKPFKWPHASIFNLPFSLLSLLETPFPIILGLNESLAFVLQNEYPTQYPDFIYVFLDQNMIVMKESLAKDIANSIPAFGNFKSRLRNIYEILNHFPSLNFPLAKKNKKTPFLYKMPNISENQNERKLNYSPNGKELAACEEIFKSMKTIIENNILSKVPAEPKYESEKFVIFIMLMQKLLSFNLI